MLFRQNSPVSWAEIPDTKYVDTTDLMRRWRVSRPTIDRYLKSGGLNRIGRQVGRQWCFRKDAVERWLAQVRRAGKKWPLKVAVRRKGVVERDQG